MFTVYEYAGGLFLLLTGATLLFLAGVMVLVLMEGVRLLAQALRKPKYAPFSPMEDEGRLSLARLIESYKL